MEYTWSSYCGLMDKLKANGYSPIRFCDVSESIDYPAIIRHDVDMDLQKAVEMAELEKRIGIKSTYFVLLSSEYYNIFSGKNMESSRRIIDLGHEIGLHFDITAYKNNLSLTDIGGVLRREILLLESGLNIKVRSISWHIPRNDLLGRHLSITDELGILNAYDPYFYKGYKYVSDSMMRWREPIEEYIEKKKYDKLQILTHPIWYSDVQNKTYDEILNENNKRRQKIINEWSKSNWAGHRRC